MWSPKGPVYLPGGACAKVNCHDVRILRVFLQECHLNLNLILARICT